MTEYSFTEKDQENLVDFFNFISKKAKFSDMSIQDSILLVKLLGKVQKEILPKIEKHIFEVKRVIEKPQEQSTEEL